MKISARNIFQGQIESVKAGAVNSEVDLLLSGGEKLVAMVTNESVQSLGLEPICQVPRGYRPAF